MTDKDYTWKELNEAWWSDDSEKRRKLYSDDLMEGSQ